jgi:hypothetical protein
MRGVSVAKVMGGRRAVVKGIDARDVTGLLAVTKERGICDRAPVAGGGCVRDVR